MVLWIESLLGLIDYLVISSFFVICMGIGWWYRKRAKAEDDPVLEFLLASRRVSLVAAVLSMAASAQSAFAFTTISGEVFRYGIQYGIMFVGLTLGRIATAYTIVPVFHKLNNISIYEFLERRFDRVIRRVVSAQNIITNCMYLGVMLYVPSISIGAVSGLPYWTVVSFGGLVCTLYSMCGLRAVIWTDVFQAVIMYSSAVLIVGFGINHVGGVGLAWTKAFNGTGLQHLTLVESSTSRYSVWCLFFYGILISFFSATSQDNMQRVLCCSNKQQASRAYISATVFVAFFSFMVVLLGVVFTAAYSRCDPLSSVSLSGVRSDDEIFIYGVSEFLNQRPGLLGLILVGLVSASLSTFSSVINSLAALTLEDFLKSMFPKKFSSQSTGIRTCIILTGFYGLLAMCLSFTFPYLGGALKGLFGINGSIQGCLTAVIFLGIFSRKTNVKACKVAYLISTVVMVCLTANTLMASVKYDSLQHTVVDCPVTWNDTWLLELNDTYQLNDTAREVHNIKSESKNYLFPISFMWLGTIAFLLMGALSLLLSYFIGDETSMDPLSPWETSLKLAEIDRHGLENISPGNGIPLNTKKTLSTETTNNV